MFNTNTWLSSGLKSNCLKRTYIQGFLDICGNIVLRNGGISLTNGDLSMNGNISVGKTATIIGDVSMNSNLQVGLDALFNRNIVIKGKSTFLKYIYQNDGYYNMNIASSVGTFPNYGTTATGPDLINIGSNNFNLVANGLSNSISIGSDIMNGSNIAGSSNIGIGKNILPVLVNGTNNLGIGNVIAVSLTSGNNNVFIGNGVATNVVSGSNIVAIGANAGRNAGNNCTFFGSFTCSLSTSFVNSTAIGYGATITKSNQIKLGTSSNVVSVNGILSVIGLTTCAYISPSKVYMLSKRITTDATVADNVIEMANPQTSTTINTYYVDNGTLTNGINGLFVAPVSGYYLIFVNFTTYQQGTTDFSIEHNGLTISEFYVNWSGGNSAGKLHRVISVLIRMNQGETAYIQPWGTIRLTSDSSRRGQTNMSGFLLAPF
jgi:hypothetical protein